MDNRINHQIVSLQKANGRQGLRPSFRLGSRSRESVTQGDSHKTSPNVIKLSRQKCATFTKSASFGNFILRGMRRFSSDLAFEFRFPKSARSCTMLWLEKPLRRRDCIRGWLRGAFDVR